MKIYMESITDQTDHFADVFVCDVCAYSNDIVMTVESLQLTPFILETSSLRKWIF